MPTYAELGQESWWVAEFEPPALAKLNADLRAFYQLGPVYIGSKGDNRHLSGYHRSRAWLQNSRYCKNRTYSTTETAGNRSGGNPNWLAAIDMTIPHDKLLAACQRLDAAVRSGAMEKVTEWYGNDDGDQQVDGYNNIQNRVASSDSSHLWHLHISLDRGRVNENHSDLYAVLTGVNQGGDDMAWWVRTLDRKAYIATGAIAPSGKIAAWYLPQSPLNMSQAHNALLGTVIVDLPGNDGGGVYDLDPQPFPVGGAAGGPTAEEIADAVADEQAERLEA